MTQNEADHRTAIERCQKRFRQLAIGLCTFEEFAYTFTLMLINDPDGTLPPCVASIPANIIVKYAVYLRDMLEPVQFMVDPLPLLVGPVTEEQIEKKKKELKPKYERLYDLVKTQAMNVEFQRK